MCNLVGSSISSDADIYGVNLAEIPWDDGYRTGNKYLDHLYGAVFASYDDFRICVSFTEYAPHISRSLSCLSKAYEQLFLYEDHLLASFEFDLSCHHMRYHDDILNKLWLAVAMSCQFVVNELEVTLIFKDWVLTHLSSQDRIYTNI